MAACLPSDWCGGPPRWSDTAAFFDMVTGVHRDTVRSDRNLLLVSQPCPAARQMKNTQLWRLLGKGGPGRSGPAGLGAAQGGS